VKGEDEYKKIFKMNHKLKNCFGKSVCGVSRKKEEEEERRRRKKENKKQKVFVKIFLPKVTSTAYLGIRLVK